MRKKILAVILTAALIAGTLYGCGSSDQSKKNTKGVSAQTEESKADTANAGDTKEDEKQSIGIAMPDRSYKKWRKAGRTMKKMLREAGYAVSLSYGENKVDIQAGQIKEMVEEGCELLIVAAVEGASLGEPLALAKEQGIPVIAYETLLRDTDGVSYYATYDHYIAGKLQGEAIEALVKAHSGEEPFYLEIFSGDAGEIDSYFLYEGAMEVLQPLIESGQVVVRSGQVTQEQTAMENWAMESAYERMGAILSTYYSDGRFVDAVLCADDSLALGVENALTEADVMEYPLVTGVGCEKENIQNLAAGKQGMDVFENPVVLAQQVAKMADDILKDGKTDVNAEASYDNGVCVVPANLSEPKACTPENYQEVLVESGYYKKKELK